MSLTLPDGCVLVTLDPADSRVLLFDYDVESNLAAGVTIAASSFKLRAIRPQPRAVTGITRSSTTATVTHVAHGRLTGDWVTIAGVDQTDYNGTFQITKLTADTYTYAVANSPTTPATGTITAAYGVGMDNASIATAPSGEASRATQVRLIAGGDRSVGQEYELSNLITTSETPAQIKEKSVRILVEQQ